MAIQVHGRRGAPETVRIYDEQGRALAAFPGRTFAWSPDGRRLAVRFRDRVEIRSIRGRVLLRRRIAGASGLVWNRPGQLAVAVVPLGSDAVRVLDARTGRISPGNDRLFGNLSPDRRLVADLVNVGRGYALRVSRLDGSGARVLARRPHCPDLVEADVQWLPDGRSLVYDLKCEG